MPHTHCFSALCILKYCILVIYVVVLDSSLLDLVTQKLSHFSIIGYLAGNLLFY